MVRELLLSTDERRRLREMGNKPQAKREKAGEEPQHTSRSTPRFKMRSRARNDETAHRRDILDDGQLP